MRLGSTVEVTFVCHASLWIQWYGTHHSLHYTSHCSSIYIVYIMFRLAGIAVNVVMEKCV